MFSSSALYSSSDATRSRFRSGPATEADLVLLDDFRKSFGDPYQFVVDKIRGLKLAPTGRPAKSTPSVIEKLKRETIRLTQMQDIAGCRIVISDVLEQDRIVASLQAVFGRTSVIDRRLKPSYGYRAVHLVAQVDSIPIEIQIRTELQHAWAQLSEKFADIRDPTIKYGGGPEVIKNGLSALSELMAELEEREYTLPEIREGRTPEGIPEVDEETAQFLEETITEEKKELIGKCQEIILRVSLERK